MGKDLKGKELGTGLYQRKDGRYEARALVKGTQIQLYDWDLKKLKKDITALRHILLILLWKTLTYLE